MMKILIVLFAFTLLLSCSKKETKIDSELIGTWKLVEILADPGDGSGTFHPVSSDKIIVFNSDGTVTSNGFICSMSTESDENDEGTYSLADSTISSNNCEGAIFKISFQLEGSVLILNYPCIEPCRAKFVKQ